MGDVSTRSVGRRLAAVGLGAALLVAVVLARGGTAATGEDLAGPSAGPSPVPSAPADADDPTTGPGATYAAEDHVRLDGVGAARLGGPGSSMSDASGNGLLVPVGTSDDGRCTLLRPALASAAGLDVVAWEVDGVVVAVAVTARDAATPARTDLGVQFGDDLAVAALLPGAVREREVLVGAAEGEVGWVVAEVDGVEVLASDLAGTVGVQHVEVRSPAGRSCRTSTPWDGAPAAAPGGVLPVLDGAGRGPVRFAQPVGELRALGLEDSDSFMAYTGCDLWYPGREAVPGTEGLGAVWVRDGQVAGIEVARGELAEGVATGDDLGALLRAFPDLVPDLGPDLDPDLVPVDPQALPPFPHRLPDGRTIDVVLLDTSVVPSEVDALVRSDRPVVGPVTLWTGDCQG